MSQISIPVYAASDHYPVCVTRKSVRKADAHVKEISYRNMKNFDENKFMADMFNASWQKLTHCPHLMKL